VIAQLLVVGSVNADLTVVADTLPGPGETVTGGRFSRGQGGKGANQAVAARRAGAEVRLVGAVGDDDHGRSARAALEAEGVDTRDLAVVAGTPTGVALIAVDAGGANQIAVASGANERVDPRAAGEAVAGLDAGRAAVLLSFELPDAPLEAAAAAAFASGLPLVVNPAPARPLAEALAACRPLLTPNEPEAAELTGHDDPEQAARALVALTRAPVVMTLGRAGALLAEPAGGVTRVPAPAVTVVDTTGAGDVFSGVLAAGLAARRELPAAVEAAVLAASRSVTAPGAR